VPDELVMAAARLARSNPNTWGEFLKLFSEYTDQRKNECVQSPPETVVVAQGKAQQCAELLTLFSDVVNKADKLSAQMK